MMAEPTVQDRRARRRPLWIAFHVGILAAGSGFALFGSVPVFTAAGAVLTGIWAAFFILGAVVSLAGAATRRWPGELVGLPFVIAGLAVYALALWATVGDAITRTGLAALLTALILPLYARWRDTAALAAGEMERARRS